MPGHTVLYLGKAPRADAVSTLLGAMDITSRLLVVTTTEPTAAAVRATVPGDLRLSVHAQSLGSFLTDVAHHVFGMVILELDVTPPVARAAAALVAPGGIAAGMSEQVAAPVPDADWVMWRSNGDSAPGWIGTRRARPAARRRGGRAARQDMADATDTGGDT